MTERSREAETDVQVLHAFGYDQVLHREVGWARSAMVNISTSSVTTAIVSLFAFGLLTAGTSIVWYWLVGFAVSMLIVLAFAELGSSLPLAGALYQWNSRIVSPRYGWLTGWIYTAAQIAICATVAYAVPPIVASLVGWNLTTTGQIVGTLITLWLAVAINVAGVVLAATVASVGAIAELVGVVGMTILLLVVGFGNQPADVVFTMSGAPAGSSFVSVALVALLFGAWAYTGLEMPTDIGEETVDARRAIPKAAITSLVTTGVVGLVFLFAITWAIPNVSTVLGAANPMQAIIEGTFNSAIWKIFAVTIVIAVFVCLTTNMMLTSRIIFSLARDQKFPASRAIGWVPRSTRVPASAIILCGLMSSGLVFWTSSIAIIAAASLSALFLAYQMTLWGSFWKRWRGDWQPAGPWQLGRWAAPVYLGGMLFGTALVVDISWPRTAGIPWWQNWMAVLFVAGTVGVGLVYYVLGGRRTIDRHLPHEEGVSEAGEVVERNAAPQPAS